MRTRAPFDLRRWFALRHSWMWLLLVGGLVYGAVAYGLDVARVRGRIGALVKARA